MKSKNTSMAACTLITIACAGNGEERDAIGSGYAELDSAKWPSGTYQVTADADGATTSATIEWSLSDDKTTGTATLTEGTVTDSKADGMSACLRVQFGGVTEYKDVGCASGTGKSKSALAWSASSLTKFPYVSACVKDLGNTAAEKAKVPVCKGGTTKRVATAPETSPDAVDAGTPPAEVDAGAPAPAPTPAPRTFGPPPGGA
jgi:hypothetical protein